MEPIVALDLFAGTGWGVACKRLGIEERGVELMAEAVATRTANGMETVYRDVWDGLLLSNEMHELLYGAYNLLIASPPCQTFSMAGNGAGRKALNEVIEAIQLHAYKVPQALLDFGKRHDIRTALVLTPLAYVYRDRPQYVAFEQVPTVLPVWEECAKIMRGWGYDVKTATLYAEQYGVPQTRKRAILVARLDGPVALPVPTHSRYYSTNPTKLDPGVHKWVSMAEALGWNRDAQVGFPQLSDGREEIVLEGTAYRARDLRAADQPAQTVTEKARSWKNFDGEDVTSVTPEEAATIQTYPNGWGMTDRPAYTFCNSGHGGAGVEWGGNSVRKTMREKSATGENWVRKEGVEPGTNDAIRVTPEEAAALQSYPTGWGFTERPAVTVGNAVGRGLIGGSGAKETVVKALEDGTFIPSTNGDGSNYAEQTRITVEEAAALQSYPSLPRASAEVFRDDYPVFRNGNQANAAVRPADRPAPTLHFGQRSNKVEWMDPDLAKDPAASGERVSPEEAAALQTFPVGAAKKMGKGMVERHGERPGRGAAEPSFTVRASAGGTEPGGFVWEHEDGSTSKVAPDQAARIQTYPGEPAFIWCGTKSKVFLQIGNAVPPLLAQRILEALTEDIDLL